MAVTFTAGPDLEALKHITHNLRERDAAEIFACRWSDDPDDLASDVSQYGEFQWMVRLDGEPVAAIGAYPAWPGVWSVWAFGTDNWPKVILSLTKHVKRFMIPAFLNQKAHRAECRALKTHTDACRWLEMLGAHKEAELAGFGRQREDFNLYVWRKENVRWSPKSRQ